MGITIWCELQKISMEITMEQKNIISISGRNADKMIAHENFLRKFEDVIHPHHELLLNVYLSLINIVTLERDMRKRLFYLRRVIECVTLIFPKYFLPNAIYFRYIGDTIGTLLDKGKFPKKVYGQFKREQFDAYEINFQISNICSGPKSVETNDAK